MKNVNRCRDTVHQEATRGQEGHYKEATRGEGGHYKEGRSLTLPSARRCLASSVAVEEDEMSDTVSEKGENMIISIFVPSFHFSGFGCTGNAFKYSSLQSQGQARRSCADLETYTAASYTQVASSS